MGFFKDFKEDFSTAAKELLPGEDMPEQDQTVKAVDSQAIQQNEELTKLDNLLEQVTEEPVPTVTREYVTKEESVQVNTMDNNSNNNTILGETSIITASTVLTGNIATAGSVDIQGTINGNVSCNGRLMVTGTINGNSSASEFLADLARVEGEIVSSGTVKIGTGSVIIGNITATSAVIAGAVKGDIDVQGPVVIDASAIILGNIKSRSVQINNGAIIEGFCSQCYADVDMNSIFGVK